jgi:alkylhydroperoxidase/carboxymuconolactone decarboxylase family protein YurZ
MEKPFYVEALEGNDRELLKQMKSLQDFASKDGALSAKVKTLMSLFGDAMLGRPQGVQALAARARAQGATEPEIAETVRMAFYFGGIPALVTAVHAYPTKQGA